MAGTEPRAWGTGRMDDITYVGLDVHKPAMYVAVAESGRKGELRQVGVFENRPEILCKMADKARQGRPSAQLLLRSWSLRIWASPFADRSRAQLCRRGALADPNEVGRPGQDRSPRSDAAGKAAPCRRANRDLDPRCRARSDARPGAGTRDGRAGAVQGAAASARLSVAP
jgi:hypothetical protein